ncbi:hypothetical protein [Streptomyces sp. RLB3-6]|uniref:hypothetical protein n=1 Tax=Streptomyces sp. RLB3-6 TaxID=2594457 RepID=UPI00116568E0|nr:hypothetical protein [Streptomyces sp. RLB3-6]QDN84429.1 hypothetical protein FNV61_00470 [Streptomyces sp. RLB3-6]
MLRIVRTTALDALRADSAALETARQELAQAQTEATTATDSAIRAETLAEMQLRQLAQAHADRIQAERERNTARAERDQAREDAQQEVQKQLAEIRAEVEQIRCDAADTETGAIVRGAIAFHMLQRLYADARARGLEAKPPVDLVALILRLDADEPAPDDKPAVR